MRHRTPTRLENSTVFGNLPLSLPGPCSVPSEDSFAKLLLRLGLDVVEWIKARTWEREQKK